MTPVATTQLVVVDLPTHNMGQDGRPQLLKELFVSKWLICCRSEKKKKARENEKQISWGHSWQSPEKVVVVKESKTESKQILEEEIKRMKNIAGYDKKTQ